MAPGTRRANRSGYAEHDDFEGLPVRQWRQEWISVAPPQQQEQTQQNDIWSIDLPHGMPKDSHLLPAHSQELLAAARSGRLYKRPAPAEEEEVDADAAPEKPEKKEEDISARGFSVKVWKQLPRNIDTASTSHLAKRQKNTVTIASRTVEERVQGPTVTRATVRRLDAAGNPYTEEVTLSDGQPVQGEIVSTRIEPAPVRGTEPLATTPVPNRRRPPPPKRKAKAGPGRGKKKIKNPLPETGVPPVAPVAGADGVVPTAPAKPENPAEAAIRQEGEGSVNQDSPMLDADDDDDEDGEDDEGDEGEEGDGTPAAESQANIETDRPQDHEMTDAAPTTTTESVPVPPPAPAPVPAPPPAALGNDEPDVVMENDLLEPVQTPANLVPPPTSLTPGGSRPEGSPLKNVVMPSPTKEVDQEQLLKAAVDAPFAGEDAPQQPALTEENLAETLHDPTGKDDEPHLAGLNEEDILQAAINAPFAQNQQLAVGPGAEPTGSTVAEPPSTIVGEAPDAATDRDVPMLEPTDNEALLPPPPEEVGNIATTPPGSSGDPSTSVPGSEVKPPMDIQTGEEAASQRPPLVQHDTGLTEDSIKPDDSASITAPTSDIADIPTVEASILEAPPQPPAETTIQEPTAEDIKPPSPPQPEIKEDSAPLGEEASRDNSPNLLDSLMNKLDRQSAESERKKQEESEPLPEAIPEVAQVPTEAISEPPADLPESIPEPVAEPPVESVPEAADEMVTESATEPTVEPTVEPATEPEVGLAAEPVAEPLAEQASEVPPEPTLIPTGSPAGPSEEPGDDLMVTEDTEPADPVLEAPEVEKPTEEAPAAPEPPVAEGEQSEQRPKID
ncbi:hypothetical protein FHETE_3598 [Fusarium heterosporum]|uniref:Apopolysialoglycoprotein n=1 Tax=Fusarium heterosporum TaxID=42747 RepID=A0A8H5TPE5_FUSHE|nr:hypothetical protein FHETE_3598 [Fusarium heterosporum]